MSIKRPTGGQSQAGFQIPVVVVVFFILRQLLTFVRGRFFLYIILHTTRMNKNRK